MKPCISAVIVAIFAFSLSLGNATTLLVPDRLDIQTSTIYEEYGGIIISWSLKPTYLITSVQPALQTSSAGETYSIPGFESDETEGSACLSRIYPGKYFQPVLYIQYSDGRRMTYNIPGTIVPLDLEPRDVKLKKINCSAFYVTWKAPRGFEEKDYNFDIYYNEAPNYNIESKDGLLLLPEKELPAQLALYIYYSNCSKVYSPIYQLEDIYESDGTCENGDSETTKTKQRKPGSTVEVPKPRTHATGLTKSVSGSEIKNDSVVAKPKSESGFCTYMWDNGELSACAILLISGLAGFCLLLVVVVIACIVFRRNK